jgi:hypothetical protein
MKLVIVKFDRENVLVTWGVAKECGLAFVASAASMIPKPRVALPIP